MANKTKMNKLKKAGVAVLLSGGLALGGVAAHRAYDNYKVNESDNAYEKDLELETLEQLEQHLAIIDEVLARLDSTINSDDTNPEARFEAHQARQEIQQNRVKVQKQLDKVRKQQNTTIHVKDINKVR